MVFTVGVQRRLSIGLIFAASAIFGCGGSGSTSLDASTDSPQPPEAAADASIAAPLLPDAVACGTRTSVGSVTAGEGLFRVDIDTTQAPTALCNDGTGGVFFVRAAQSPEAQNRWVIHTQGGGVCRSPQACLDRWCSEDTAFGAQKMSSAQLPNAIRAVGIHADREENPTRDWNHVFLYYCSSDLWTGSRSDVLASADSPDGTATDFRIHFRGNDIFSASIAALRGEFGGPVRYDGSDGMTHTMPDLDAAEQVILAGGSAGASGVAFQLDRLGAWLGSERVMGIHDSNFGLRLWEIDWSLTTLCSERGLCDYESFQRNDDTTTRPLWGAQVDESCSSWHAANAPDLSWRCMDTTWTLLNHITTPVFIRMDLGDSLIGGNAVATQFSTDGVNPMTADDFSAHVREGFMNLSNLRATALEGSEILHPPGYFGTWCGTHESLGRSLEALETRAPAPDGTALTMFEMMEAWQASRMSYGGAVERPGQGCP